MSILLKPTRLDKDREPVEVFAGDHPGNPWPGGEPIPPRPLRLSPAELAEIVRVGYIGDAPDDHRLAVDERQHPDVARAYVERLTAGEPDATSRLAQECGAWYGQYRILWGLYMAKLVELDRRRFEFWPDECPVQDWEPADDEPAGEPDWSDRADGPMETIMTDPERFIARWEAAGRPQVHQTNHGYQGFESLRIDSFDVIAVSKKHGVTFRDHGSWVSLGWELTISPDGRHGWSNLAFFVPALTES